MSAQTVSNAVATRDSGPVAVMWSKKKHFDAVLPASVDVEAFLGTAAGALYADPKTMAAAVSNPDSLITVLMKCAALGHLPGTEEFYLYNRKRKGRPEVAGTEGYRGIIERMYRSGAVAKVVVREVCADDPFEYVEGEDRVPRHHVGGEGTTGAAFFGAKGDRKRGEMVGVYSYAELTTGAVSRIVLLSRDDVHAARDSGDAKDSDFSPWNRLDGGAAHPEFKGRSMWWKTAARRLEPWVPTSREYRASMLTASARAAELAPPPRLMQLPPSDSAVVDAEIVDEQDASPAGTETTPRSAPSATPSADVPPAGEAPTPRLATTGQVGMIRSKFTELYPGPESDADRWERLGQTAKLAGIDTDVTSLGSTNDLTMEQATQVREALKKVSTAAELEALIASGEVPGHEG